MSLVLLGILNSQAAGGGASYWLSAMSGSGGEFAFGGAVDSGDNLYSTGYTSTATGSGQDYWVVKQDSAGEILFQKRYGASQGQIARSIAVDSSDNTVVYGYQGTYLITIKLNSSGTIQWQRALQDSFYGVGYGQTAIDSANNIYVVGAYAGTRAFIAKYNSSGTLQWQKYLGTGSSTTFSSVAIDSSDNVYALGRTDLAGAGFQDWLIAKYNSSGTIQWQRVFGAGGSEDVGQIRIDSSNNIYAVGQGAGGAGSNDLIIAKYNSSGTLQWQRYLGGASTDEGKGLAFDSSDNIYVAGFTNSDGAGNSDFVIAKYNSSGTIQWQRTIGTTGSDRGRDVVVDSFDSVYVLGDSSGLDATDASSLIAKIPNDGSLEGTYSLGGVNVVYEASTLTAGTSSFSGNTPSLSSGTSTLTTPTITLTAATTTISQDLVNL